MSETHPTAVRTWKRDGTQDVMDLDAAVENLSRYERGTGVTVEERREAVRKALLAGETLETPHASFALES